MYDLVVMGGGPAGLTATIYAVRKRLNVLLLTKDLGGKTNYQLNNTFAHDYHGVRGAEVVEKFKRELEYLDFVRLMDEVTGVERVAADGVNEANEGGFSLHTKK